MTRRISPAAIRKVREAARIGQGHSCAVNSAEEADLPWWRSLLSVLLTFLSIPPLAACSSLNNHSSLAAAKVYSDPDLCIPITPQCQRLCSESVFRDVCHGSASREKWIELSRHCANNLQRMSAGDMQSIRRPYCTEMELVLERISGRLSPALSGNLDPQNWMDSVAANLYPQHRQQLLHGIHPQR